MYDHRTTSAVRKRTLETRIVCPEEDWPFGFFRNLGWNALDTRIWGFDATSNPIIYYLIGRRHRIDPTTVLIASSWVFLTILGGGVVYFGYTEGPIVTLLWLLAEVFILPIFVSYFTQNRIARFLEDTWSGNLYQQISLTKLTPQEFVNGFALRPVVDQLAFLRVSTLLWALGIFSYLFRRHTLIIDVETVTLGFCFAVLCLRYIYTSAMAQMAAVLAVRSLLFLPERNEARMRMYRDLFPWAIFPVVVLVVSLVSVILISFLFAILPLLLLLGIPFMIWMLFIGPGFMRESATDKMFWLLRSHRDWHLYTNEKGNAAPRSLWKGWSQERRIRELRA